PTHPHHPRRGCGLWGAMWGRFVDGFPQRQKTRRRNRTGKPAKNYVFAIGGPMTETATLTADDLLWNWARWCWAGETVGNMVPYQPHRDDFRPIMVEHAQAVERLHGALPR